MKERCCCNNPACLTCKADSLIRSDFESLAFTKSSKRCDLPKAADYRLVDLIISRVKQAQEDVKNYKVVLSLLIGNDEETVMLRELYEDKIYHLQKECAGLDLNVFRRNAEKLLPLNYFEN